MGLLNQGIPREIVGQLARLSQASVFIETGTFRGATARWAAGVFDQVHTIELARQLYEQAQTELSAVEGIQQHFGDSAEILPNIVAELGAQPAVFWLDGHWSGGETAGESSECPLMAELACLVGRRQDVILIDDARLFLCAPPKPHRPEHWPTLADIVRVFERHPSNPRFLQIIDDVIFIVDANSPVQQLLIHYAQGRAEAIANRATPTRIRKFAAKLLRA